MSAPTLEASSKVPVGLSPVTGERYFPVTFNCMKELHGITQTSEKNLGKFNRPNHIGHFSLDGDRKFLDNDSQLKYFAPPVNRFGQPMRRPNFNLSMGMKDGSIVKKDERHFEGLDNLFHWCTKHWEQVCSENVSQPNVMTWRGILTKIMMTPYDNNTEWNIVAIKYKGTIYLAEYKTEAMHQKNEKKPEWVKKTMYWGRKVETYLTSDKPAGPNNQKDPVNENAEYTSVFRTKLGHINLMYGAEIDCVDHTLGEEFPPPSNFIEIKTQQELKDKNKKTNFRKYKLSKWWAQCYLAGIPRVMAAFRDDRGFVQQLEIIETAKMPQVAAQEAYSWKPPLMTGFLEKFLTFIRDVMAKVEDVAYVFEWNPEWEGICFTFDPDKTKEYYFIPDWYKKHIEDAAHELALKKARAEEERAELKKKMEETPDGEAIVLD